MRTPGASKDDVLRFWDAASCGEVYAEGRDETARLTAQAKARFELEPYLPEFARFADGKGIDVLEIGVGMGADHLEWAKSGPRSLTGIDLTPRAIQFTRRRLELAGLSSNLQVGDAERLPFPDASFDLVYSWGVLHHSPDTPGAIEEVRRVLRPGGQARLMIYHKWSLVGLMLWARYGLGTGHPLTGLEQIYAQHLESPGTKAYTVEEAREMCRGFTSARIWSRLSFGDLLEGAVGQRHEGSALRLARRVWPRRLLRRVAPRWGLALLIDARR